MLLEKISLLSGASISTSLAMPAGKSQHGEGSLLTLPRTANDTTKIGMRFRRSISRNVPKRREGRNFNPTLSLRLFLCQEPRQQLRQRDTARLQPFELRTARFGQRKVHLAFVLFAQFSYHESLALHRPDHLRRIRTGQPEHLRNLARREFPMPCEAAEQHPIVHRQAIFPLETLFELGDRARHFAYAAERIHRTISTDTPRSPF